MMINMNTNLSRQIAAYLFAVTHKPLSSCEEWAQNILNVINQEGEFLDFLEDDDENQIFLETNSQLEDLAEKEKEKAN